MTRKLIPTNDPDRVMKHASSFLALIASVDFRNSNGQMEQSRLVYSGFVMSVQGEWFLITAGHCLEGINDLQQSGYKFHSWNLRDFKPKLESWVRSLDAPEPPYDSIPFDFEAASKSHIYDAETGLDYACIHIRELFRNTLLGNCNAVQPFPESHWRDNQPHEFTTIELIGIPSSTVKNRGKSLTTQLFCTPVTPIESPYNSRNDAHIFYGIIQTHLDTIKGMSGGPIVGFCYEESEPYLIAIQSGWNPGSKIIFGPWARPLGLAIEEHLQKY